MKRPNTTRLSAYLVIAGAALLLSAVAMRAMIYDMGIVRTLHEPNAEHTSQRYRGESDHERHPSPVYQARKYIAAKDIGAEHVSWAQGRLQSGDEVLGVGILRREHRRQDTDDDEDHDDHHREGDRP